MPFISNAYDSRVWSVIVFWYGSDRIRFDRLDTRTTKSNAVVIRRLVGPRMTKNRDMSCEEPNQKSCVNRLTPMAKWRDQAWLIYAICCNIGSDQLLCPWVRALAFAMASQRQQNGFPTHSTARNRNSIQNTEQKCEVNCSIHMTIQYIRVILNTAHQQTHLYSAEIERKKSITFRASQIIAIKHYIDSEQRTAIQRAANNKPAEHNE